MAILQQPAQRIGLTMYYHAEINAQVGSNRAFLQSLSMLAESHGDTPSWGGYTVDFIPPSAVRYREGGGRLPCRPSRYIARKKGKKILLFWRFIFTDLSNGMTRTWAM
jgi:hypothetical protein